MTIPTTATALVVGAGPSGLAALKEMKEAGIEAIAVDSRSDFGGVFSPSSNVTYDGLYLTTTNMFMAFSDFPPACERVKYWSKHEYYNYLESYVQHFGFASSIYLETTVLRAKLIDNDWQVVFKTKEGDTAERRFDYLVVATGANHKPYLPAHVFEGFKGEILHSHQYHSPKQVEGKRTLVIGVGESAADVINSSAKTAKKVTVWSRHYPRTAPRFITNCLCNKNYSEDVYLQNQENENRTPRDFLETILTSRIVRNMPLFAWSAALQKGLFADLKTSHGSKSPAGLKADWCLESYKTDFFSGDHSSVPTKTMMISTAASARKIDLVVAPRIRCNSSGVVFEEPMYHGLEKTSSSEDLPIDVDIIISCTGYDVAFDWLEVPGLELEINPRYWFKHCFPQNIGHKLAFLGYARPHQGGIPQCSEILARYITQLVLKDAVLPNNYTDLALAEGKCEEDCFHLSKHVLVLVDYSAFMLSVARLVGCEPALPRTLSGVVKYWTFPMWSCFFRTEGVGAKPEACQKVLDKFRTFDAVAPMPLAAIQVILTFAMPFLNLVSFILAELFGNLSSRSGLPRFYQFRMSKMFFMSGNNMRLRDVIGPSVLAQWVAAFAMILHGVASMFRGVGSSCKKTCDQFCKQKSV